jgi:hypothetical protein
VVADQPAREALIKIGAKVVSHGRYVIFQMACVEPVNLANIAAYVVARIVRMQLARRTSGEFQFSIIERGPSRTVSNVCQEEQMQPKVERPKFDEIGQSSIQGILNAFGQHEELNKIPNKPALCFSREAAGKALMVRNSSSAAIRAFSTAAICSRNTVVIRCRSEIGGRGKSRLRSLSAFTALCPIHLLQIAAKTPAGQPRRWAGSRIREGGDRIGYATVRHDGAAHSRPYPAAAGGRRPPSTRKGETAERHGTCQRRLGHGRCAAILDDPAPHIDHIYDLTWPESSLMLAAMAAI